MRLRRVMAALVTAVALVATAAPGVAQGAVSDSQPSVVGLKSSDGAKGASVLSEKWLDARTVDLQLSAPKVRAAAIPVRVMLPVGYSASSGRTYPVVFMLHGGQDDYTSWTRETDIAAVSAGYDAIVVMPDGGESATWTNYLRPYQGNPLQWETFHTVELPEILQQGYRANQSWAVAGLSSGGYGAMAYASQNPGMFKYAASYSGPLAIRVPVVRSFLMVSSLDLNPYARWGVPLLDEGNWIKNDPTAQAANLRGTGLYVSCGTTGLPSSQDTEDWSPVQVSEAVIATTGQVFTTRLKQLRIPVTTHFYTLGEHAWPAWESELHTSYPLMMQAIGAQKV